MNDIKRRLAEEIKKEIHEFSELTDEEVCAYFFNHSSTLRLTTIGFKNLRTIYTVYDFNFDNMYLKSRHLIALGNTLEYPYYLTAKNLFIFSETDALMIKLCGSVEKFLEKYTK